MKKYYDFLGVPEYATDEEIDVRYQELREKYREDRWLEGDAGNQAAKNLTKLETAYKEIKESRKERGKNTSGLNSFEEIAEMLKQDRVAEAQAALDKFDQRTAEWHYLQAVVYYKKNWTNESKKQLEIAMQMEPSNGKYRAAYAKMNAKNEYQNQSAYPGGAYQNPYNNHNPQDNQMGGTNCCSECCSFCYTYLCVSCLFDMCCSCR
jgi:DnaJ-class molecular chaperone